MAKPPTASLVPAGQADSGAGTAPNVAPEVAPDVALEARLQTLLRDHRNIQPAALVEVVESIVSSAQGDLSSVNLRLYTEIEALSNYIQAARSEIASLRPDEITDEHLPAAGEELEAIVGATEQATNGIMEAVEAIENEAARLDPEAAERITEAVTRVYEACSFQDITGQRITKVVNCLKHIETKVNALLDAFGQEVGRQEERAKRSAAVGPVPPSPSDGHLMNGPQLPENAISQADIDALLASFD